MKTLAQYEDELKEAIKAVTLIGQLDYDETDLDNLRRNLRPWFINSTTAGLEGVGRHFPLAFTLYLVLEGLYQYKGGDYWSGPREALALSGNYTSQVGRLFRDTVRAEDLPTFENLVGHANIAPILAHGGIPNYCLDDFFALLDWVNRRRAAVDVPTLLDEWAAEGFKINIDRPAQRFLLHGSDVAEEFVERCLALWQETEDPESLDLPPRVLGRFDAWCKDNPDHRNGQRDVRLIRPKLTYDPYGEGLAIVLPPVTYRAGSAPMTVTWRIEAGDRLREEKTFRRSLGEEIEFAPRADVVNVLTIAPVYRVTALADAALLHTWALPGPAALPLLAFDSATGALLADRQQQNEREYWLTPGERALVFPRGASIVPEQARKLVELPDPGGEWSRFVFETWSLEPDSRVDVIVPDGGRVAFRARNDPPPARPFLDGAPLIAPSVHERSALYNGRPPLLRIPPGKSEHKPEKWRIEITPVGAADPPTPRAFSLADLPQHCVMAEGTVLLSLDAPELLGPSPLGEFHIYLRGPYPRTANFDVRFAPGLRFEEYPQLILANGDKPAEFRVIHADECELEAGHTSVALGPAGPAYPMGISRRLTVSPEATRAPLILRGARGQLDFALPIYRLRFGLVEPDRPDTFHWVTSPIRLHPDALESIHTASLRVDLPLPPGVPLPNVQWRLVAPDGQTLREQPPRLWSRHPQTTLLEWLDTFREGGRLAILQLVILDGEDTTAIDIARLLPTLELGNVETAWRIDENGDHLTILWETSVAARNRQLRLWPVDRPWVTSPTLLPVPDEATDFAIWKLAPGRLPLGEYLAEMVIDDPWTITEPERPEPDAPNVFLLRPDDVEAALETGLARARRDELAAEDALAWVIYLTRTGTCEAIARFNITLWRNRSALSMEQLLLWTDAARHTTDETAYRIAQKALFEGSRIVELIKEPDDRRATYLGHLPVGLDAAVYRVLLHIAAGEPRRICLENLCRMGDKVGLQALLDDFRLKAIKTHEAVKWLSPISRQATDFLYADGSQTAKELLRALLNVKPDDRFITKGDPLWTNVGKVLVTGIRNSQTQDPVDICIKNGEHFLLQGRLWPGDSDLPVQIDLKNQTVQILKSPVYPCRHTGKPQCDYVYANPGELKRHYRQKHKMDSSDIQQKFFLKIHLTYISFLPPDGDK